MGVDPQKKVEGTPPLSRFPFLPLRSRPPYIQLWVWGRAVSSRTGVWGGAPAQI